MNIGVAIRVGDFALLISPFPKPFSWLRVEEAAEICYYISMATLQSFPTPPPSLSPVHKVTLQFITIAMCAVAFLIVAKANGYLWEGDFSFFGWIFN